MQKLIKTLSGKTLAAPKNQKKKRKKELQYTETILSDAVYANDNLLEDRRQDVYTGYIHVSSLIGSVCPRKLKICADEGLKPKDAVDGNMRIVWAMGRAVETHIRDSIISTNRSESYGKWSCPCEKTVTTGFGDEIVTCNTCGKAANRYVEFTLEDHEARIVGNPDFLYMVEGKLLPTEIKSKEASAWDELEAPEPNHVSQVLCYYRILKRMGLPVWDKVALIYARKKYMWGKSPYKEYHVSVGEEQESQLDRLWEKACNIRESFAKDTLPEKHSLCTSLTTTKAKNCDCLASCFTKK